MTRQLKVDLSAILLSLQKFLLYCLPNFQVRVQKGRGDGV